MTSPAATLRTAASQMRKLAEKATLSPWTEGDASTTVGPSVYAHDQSAWVAECHARGPGIQPVRDGQRDGGVHGGDVGGVLVLIECDAYMQPDLDLLPRHPALALALTFLGQPAEASS